MHASEHWSHPSSIAFAYTTRRHTAAASVNGRCGRWWRHRSGCGWRRRAPPGHGVHRPERHKARGWRSPTPGLVH